MSPILDSIGSVKGYGWGSFSEQAVFQSIATFTRSTSGFGTFTNIPQTFKHLQLRVLFRGTPNQLYDQMLMSLNQTTGITKAHWNYSLMPTPTFASGNSASNYSSYPVYYGPGNTAVSGYFAPAIIDIYNYSSTTTNKTIMSSYGFNNYGGSNTYDGNGLTSGIFLSNNAITSIGFQSNFGDGAVGTMVSLYGVVG